ncbi:MAG: DUF1499 domain-containing protein [Rhodobacteraceae bacterium]|nr:DUF1499 domain-containing protein [Paracoccaceae bacterium]
MIKLAAFVALGLGVALLAWIRLAPHDPARWHEDPTLVSRPGTPNHHLIRLVGGDAIAPIYDTTPEVLARTIDGIAQADGAERIAGSVADGHMTYVSRTRWMGYPDYTSVRVARAGQGATFSAFARARFGRSDFGVNRARLERWQAALDATF